jgi:hypothetical protein
MLVRIHALLCQNISLLLPLLLLLQAHHELAQRCHQQPEVRG